MESACSRNSRRTPSRGAMVGRPFLVPLGVVPKHILCSPRHISRRTAGSWSSSSKALSQRLMMSGLPVEIRVAGAGSGLPSPAFPPPGPPGNETDENIHDRRRLMAKWTNWTRPKENDWSFWFFITATSSRTELSLCRARQAHWHNFLLLVFFHN